LAVKVRWADMNQEIVSGTFKSSEMWRHGLANSCRLSKSWPSPVWYSLRRGMISP